MDRKPFLSAQGISKSFGNTKVLTKVDFSIPQGNLFALLGGSGSGKTTILRILAGFTSPNTGTIHLEDRDITLLPPHARSMAMVFQNFALWPHMTVFENIAYGLHLKKRSSADIKKKVMETLALVRLTETASHYPQTLSGGQQQRVALARALAVEPRVLLMDEPLSNLDPGLREGIRREIRELQQTLGITTIYVTHDRKEAISLADTVALLDTGAIVETGTPFSLYQTPKTITAARFFGELNEISGTVSAQNKPYIEINSSLGNFSVTTCKDLSKGEKVIIGFRPDSLEPTGTKNIITGTIKAIEYQGESLRLSLSCGDLSLIASLPGNVLSSYKQGERIQMGIKTENILLFQETL